jgi:hypothetical protein
LSNKVILHKYVEAVINYAGKEENSKWHKRDIH